MEASFTNEQAAAVRARDAVIGKLREAGVEPEFAEAHVPMSGDANALAAGAAKAVQRCAEFHDARAAAAEAGRKARGEFLRMADNGVFRLCVPAGVQK